MSSKKSSSKYVGVWYDNTRNKWSASITLNNRKHLGYFTKEIDACYVRDLTAYELNLQGNLFRIHLPEDLQCNLFIKSLSEEYFNFNYLFY